MKCSLIISSYNWPSALEICLLSVLAQHRLPDEIIIADDGSSEETVTLINLYRQNFPVPLHHIWHEDNGFRKTIILNKAIAKSRHNYIIQIDGDVILEKNFILDHISVSETGTFIRGTRAMISEQKTSELLAEKSIHVSIFSSGIKHRNNGLRLSLLRRLGIRKQMSSNSVRGSNLAFWKADFININGYDNNLQGWGHEDEELAARFINAGVIKKIVKLCAVQFHLYHKVANKDNEPDQRQAVDEVVRRNIKEAKNGYRQVSNQ